MINHKNNENDNNMPLGFGMTLVQNRGAFDYFSSLSPTQQQSIIDGAKTIQSKQEMRSYVRSLEEQAPLNQ